MTPATTPQLPYDARPFPYGLGRVHLTKVRPNGDGGDILTPDELAVWERVKWLEAENARLKAELEAATTAVSDGKRKGK